MSEIAKKVLKVVIPISLLGGIYLLALHKHAEREEIRQTTVALTPSCAEKFERYALVADDRYQSPYVLQHTGTRVSVRGYSEKDIKAIQRGCNIIDDTQGHLAKNGAQERWNATRFVRGTHTSCDHCHQGVGDKQDAAGNRLIGSNSLAASWVMADMYDRFTGMLLPYELRQMQCYINSSNGYKPNTADDLVRDVTAYSRFLSAALNLKIGNRYPEQGIDEITTSETLKRGDDYIRGKALYQEKCARCHGPQGLGVEANGQAVYPAVAGPNAYNLQSRMNFANVHSLLPGFICRNMPLGEEGSLDNQQCRDIAYYIGTLPRPASDLQGPLAALQQQLMMTLVPPLLRLVEPTTNGNVRPMAAPKPDQ
jgi:thiosulfate dehydrogenase